MRQARGVFVFLWLVLFLFGIGPFSKADEQPNAADSAKSNFYQICDTSFEQWDRNHDGLLDIAEVNALIENPQVHGSEGAAVVVIRGLLGQTTETSSKGISRTDLLTYAEEPSAIRHFTSVQKKLESINHDLFLPGDPNLITIHQGQLSDCYLIAVIGALVNRDPQVVRDMIKPLANGNFEVDFPTGKIVTITPPTDAELVMGAKMENDSGIWLGVLEKAYASIRKENNMTDVSRDDEAPRDFLRGGRAPPTIREWTGHQAEEIILRKAFHDDTQKAVETLDSLFVKLTSDQRLITVGGGDAAKKMPKGIPHGHIFALLSYDHSNRALRLFNPWCNNFTPSGNPGLLNGYVTTHGVFDIPLQDFAQIFHSIAYETREPLNHVSR